ncbi:MAG TPA: BTAD domain-containing putative transcriptional regulator [Nonomuraea sp.]|nr:BTAD domain-containing putative transcriptional regulator [Nonomuraea sp.]
MTFVAKAIPPLPADQASVRNHLRPLARGGIAVVTAASGLLQTEGIAAAFADRPGRLLWARLGREDRDPAAFALMLVDAARRADASFGGDTLDLMRRRPGPLHGWTAVYDLLGQELRGHLGEGTMVLEHADRLGGRSPVLDLVGAHLLPVLHRSTACVLITARPIRLPGTEARVARLGPRELSLSEHAVALWIEENFPGCAAPARRRLQRLTGGRAAVLDAVRAVRDRLGSVTAERRLAQAGHRGEPLAVPAEALLGLCDTEELRVLGLTGRLGYGRPGLPVPDGPWLQRLAGGWTHVRGCWRAQLMARAAPDKGDLRDGAEWLLRCGGLEQAVDLYLELGDHRPAAELVADRMDDLIGLGQWDALRGWLARLPEEVVAAYPQLSYGRAELAAARGDLGTARKSFAMAAARFGDGGDAAGVCRCLLAESAVAARRGDLAMAMARVGVARSLAAASGLARLEFWTYWSEGMLTLGQGDREAALAAFRSAAEHRDPTADGVMREAYRLLERGRELRLRREAHQSALATLEQQERATATDTIGFMTGLPQRLLDGSTTWAELPLPLRFPPHRARSRRWHRRGERPRRHVAEPPSPVQAPDRPEPHLAIHLLGPLHVSIDDRQVSGWPGGLCRSLLAYIVTHREPWPRREALMDVFWPKADATAARNSLNVAIHGIRRVLRTVTDLPVIVLCEGAYRVHPAIRLWIDVEPFEQAVESGRRFERDGRPDEAARSYEVAVELYRGNFLDDAPYEDWPAVLRERLRLADLEALDRLSSLHFLFGRYPAAADLCRRIIDLDPCREDAHRRLMRCYSRQSLPHLALLQYRACVRVLAGELGVTPAPETTALHERIRGHEQV